MSLNQFVLHAIFIGIFNAVFALAFVGVLIWNHARKKTSGTALLLVVFIMVFINALANPLVYYFQASNPSSTAGGAFVVIFLVAYMLTNFFLYNFSNRHIFNDGPIVQNIINSLILVLTTIVTSIMSYEIAIGVENGIFIQTFIQSATGVELMLPSVNAGLILYIPIFVGFQLRLILHICYILIKERDADPVKRIALIFVLLSIFFMVCISVLTFFFTIPDNGERVIQLLHAFGGIFTLLMIIFGYFGWVLPNWLKKRLQKRFGLEEDTLDIFPET